MNKDLKARIESAPDEILVRVTQHHIDQFKGQRFDFEENPIGAALAEAGWIVISIGVYESYVGGKEGGVPYVAAQDTQLMVDKLMKGDPVQPCIVEFRKKPIDKPAVRCTDGQLMTQDDILTEFF